MTSKLNITKENWIPEWACHPSKIPNTTLGFLVWSIRLLYRGMTIVTLLFIAVIVIGMISTSDIIRVVSSFVLMFSVPIILLKWVSPVTSSYILQTRIKFRKKIKFEWVDYDNISPHLVLAVMVSEDALFPWHIGFDPINIYRAYKSNRTRQPLRGGSSITQQLVKNLFLWPARSYLRKVIELAITLLIEGILTKKRIIEIYLNIIQFDHAVFGVKAACRHFYNKNPIDITFKESALMAAVVPNPIIYRIESPSALVSQNQAVIEKKMQLTGLQALNFK